MLCASSLATASIASFLLSSIMITVILLSRRYNINPDNVATPIAASLGDLITISVLSVFGTLFLRVHLNESWLNVFVILLFFCLIPLFTFGALRENGTKNVLLHGWSPIIFSMVSCYILLN